MKILSYLCPMDTVSEVRTALIGLGANIIKQVQIFDVESIPPTAHARLIFMVDKETEIVLRLKFPPGTFIDCTI